jgi:hypothetical protein
MLGFKTWTIFVLPKRKGQMASGAHEPVDMLQVHGPWEAIKSKNISCESIFWIS